MTDLKVKVGVGGTRTKKVIWEGGENDPYTDIVALSDSEGNVASAQYPIPTNGDSAYCKDINEAISAIGTFTGDLCSLFTDYQAEITDMSAENLKTFEIAFERPITTNNIKLSSFTGTFSNVVFSLKDPSGAVRKVVDYDKFNDAPQTSNIYEFTSTTFLSVVVEFHTGNAIKISGMSIPKVQSRSISSIEGIISQKNSSLIPLGANETFPGEMDDTKNYGAIQVALYSETDCTFYLWGKSTPTSVWRLVETYEVTAGEDKAWSFQGVRRFAKIEVVNGPDAQGVNGFDLQTMFKPVYVKPSSHPIGGVVKSNDDAELVKAQITGERPDGNYGNVAVTNGNNLKQSLEEFDPAFVTNPLPVREYPPDLDGSNYLSVHLLAGAAVDMAVNGSVTPVDYSYTVPAGKKLCLNRLLTAIEDGTQAFIPGNFGAGGALSNGLEISITPSGGSKQTLETWKTNREIRDTMFDFDQQFKSNGAYVGRWTLAKDVGTGLTLTAGDVITARVQDDLSILDYLSIRLKAKIENV